jgi:hypothetical protein
MDKKRHQNTLTGTNQESWKKVKRFWRRAKIRNGKKTGWTDSNFLKVLKRANVKFQKSNDKKSANMAARGGGAGRAEGIQKELEELRSRITSLEQDNEMLMDLVKNISKVFAGNNAQADDDKMEYKKGVSKTLNIIIRNVGKGALITAAQYSAIEKYSDLSTYADAEWFRKQLIVAFENFYFHVNKEAAWEFKFQDVKDYLQDVSKFDDKAEFHVYVKNLKPKKEPA